MGLTGLAIAGLAAGTGLQIAGTLQAGKDAQAIAESRAAIDRQSADVRDEATNKQAMNLEGERRSAIAAGKRAVVSGNVKLGVGLDVVAEAEINRVFFEEKKFTTAAGREESSFLRSRADLEIASGKAARKRSRRSAFATGLSGFGSIAFMGTQSSSGVRSQSSRFIRGTGTRNFPTTVPFGLTRNAAGKVTIAPFGLVK